MSKERWLLVITSLAALAAVGYWFFAVRQKADLVGTELNQPVAISGLSLMDQHGRAVDLADDFSGKVTLVFFGYTRCPDVCPLTMARLARAYDQLGGPEDLGVVMVSVDPGFDTPEVLAEYLGRFNPGFVGLTGSNSQVAEAAKQFFVGFAGNAPAVAHTDMVAVLDRQGRMRYLYGQEQVIRIGDDLPALLKRL